MPEQQLISYRVPQGDSWLVWSEIKLEGRKAGAVHALIEGLGNQSGSLLVRQLSFQQTKETAFLVGFRGTTG